ncbi:hypothetical protein, partial [Staphylococcus hominis]|uniref:hypothetical protein n=1 Tax=Staphylococcus hominis TaxID=1290 RepID=UPI001E5024DB
IRKVAARRAENNQKNYKKDNFYIISIEIVFFHLFRNFMSQTHDYIVLISITKRYLTLDANTLS